MENLLDANFEMVSRPEMAAVLEIHLARRNDPDLDREVAPSTRRFDRRVRLWGYSILHAAGIKDDQADRQSVAWGRSVSVPVNLGGCRLVKKKNVQRRIYRASHRHQNKDI